MSTFIELLSSSQSTCVSTPRTDVWALGVILVNLLTKRCPWSVANQKDRHYDLFSQMAETFFIDRFPFTPRTNNILVNIFMKDPFKRISIEELRTEIEETETFYTVELDEEEDEKSTTPEAPVKNEDAQGSQDKSMDVDPKMTFIIGNATSLSDNFNLNTPPLSTPGDGDDSQPESKGPITPETDAADVANLSDPDVFELVDEQEQTHQEFTIPNAKPNSSILSSAAKASGNAAKASRRVILQATYRYARQIS